MQNNLNKDETSMYKSEALKWWDKRTLTLAAL